MFTVRQLSQLAGVTPRTLRYYDAIGLLAPSHVGENGYRYYGQPALLRLQQILFYRELGLPLANIKQMMQDPGFDILAALESHKQALGDRMARLGQLIQTVEETIKHLKGETTMSNAGFFAGFNEEQQEEYARQAEQMYDPVTVRESNRKWKSYSEEKKRAILDEGRQIYLEMVAAMPQGAEAPAVQAIVERWRRHMDYFWTPDLGQLLNIAALYEQSPDFKTNFDGLHPGLAGFMRRAVEVYVAKYTDLD